MNIENIDIKKQKSDPFPSPKSIDSDFTDEIVCPYCGHEYDNSFEFFIPRENEEQPRDGDISIIECDSCGKGFSVTINFEITYTSTKRF